MADAAGRPLRLGLCGHGWVIEHGYLPALRRSDSRFEVAAIAEPGPAAAARAKVAWPEATVVADVGQLLASGVDAVLVASPNPEHLAQAVAAMEAGLPCLVEKPLLRDLGDLAVLEAATGDGLLVPAVVCRHRADTQCWLAGLAELGTLKRLALSWRRHRGVPSAAWHHREAEGWTGVFADLGAHLVDILGAALGWQFEDLECSGLRCSRGGSGKAAAWYGASHLTTVDVVTGVEVTLDAGSIRIELAAAWTDEVPGDLVRLEAVGSEGSVVLEGLFGFSPERRVPQQRVCRYGRDGSLLRQDDFEPGPRLQLAGFDAVLRHFADAIDSARPTDWRPIQFAAVLGSCLGAAGR